MELTHLTPDHITSGYLPCFPVAYAMDGFAFICVTRGLASASPTSLSLSDGSIGSAFGSPPGRLPATGSALRIELLNQNCGHQ